MSLAEAMGGIIESAKQRKLLKIKQRLAVMNDKWWSQRWQETYKMMDYYYKKPDEKTRHMALVLKMEWYEDICRTYQKIVEEMEKNPDFDLQKELVQLSGRLKQKEEEINTWKRKFYRYEGSEKFVFQ